MVSRGKNQLIDKVCNRCGHVAEISVCTLVSTIARRPRLQKCSQAVALCSVCATQLGEETGFEVPVGIQRAFCGAYTALASLSTQQSKGENEQ